LGDLIAGITIGIMLIPQGMIIFTSNYLIFAIIGLAYSSLVMMPAINGLYTACFPVIIYVLFGTSKQLSIGPESVLSILVGTNIQTIISSQSSKLLLFIT
jgi:SulP family sulfate permease